MEPCISDVLARPSGSSYIPSARHVPMRFYHDSVMCRHFYYKRLNKFSGNMVNNICPLCECAVNVTNRLIEESCGHKKCRNCFIQERLGCKSCQNTFDKEINELPHEKQPIEKSQSRNCVKKFNGQLKLKTEWTILSETSSNIGSHQIAKKDSYSQSLDSTLEKTIVNDLKSNLGSIRTTIGHIKHASNAAFHKNIKNKKNPAAKQINTITLPNHINTIQSNEQILYECSICRSRFKFKYHYRYHEFCHNGAKPFKCEYCSKTYKTLPHLNYHVKTHTSTKTHQCKDCGKFFMEIGALNRHVKTHDKTRSFHCNICEESFSTNASLSAHIFRHNNKNLFTCDICQKQFNDRSNFRKHVSLHDVQLKKFLCEKCGKSFKMHWSLVAHKLNHSGDKSHNCHKCDRIFMSANTLKRHLWTHTSAKQYSCEYCETQCRRKDNLERHIRNTHPEKIAFHKASDKCIKKNFCYKKPLKKQIVTEINTPDGFKEVDLTNKNVKEFIQKRENSYMGSAVTTAEHVDHLNSVNVIKSHNSLPSIHKIESFNEENFRIPVINGPIKLSLKNEQHSVKQNRYRNIEEKLCEDHHLDICRKILQAPVTLRKEATHSIPNERMCKQSGHSDINNINDSNVTKGNQEYHIEVYRKILMPSYIGENKMKNHLLNSTNISNTECKNNDRIPSENQSYNFIKNNQAEKLLMLDLAKNSCDNHVSTITLVSSNKIIHPGVKS